MIIMMAVGDGACGVMRGFLGKRDVVLCGELDKNASLLRVK